MSTEFLGRKLKQEKENLLGMCTNCIFNIEMKYCGIHRLFDGTDKVCNGTFKFDEEPQRKQLSGKYKLSNQILSDMDNTWNLIFKIRKDLYFKIRFSRLDWKENRFSMGYGFKNDKAMADQIFLASRTATDLDALTTIFRMEDMSVDLYQNEVDICFRGASGKETVLRFQILGDKFTFETFQHGKIITMDYKDLEGRLNGNSSNIASFRTMMLYLKEIGVTKPYSRI